MLTWPAPRLRSHRTPSLGGKAPNLQLFSVPPSRGRHICSINYPSITTHPTNTPSSVPKILRLPTVAASNYRDKCRTPCLGSWTLLNTTSLNTSPGPVSDGHFRSHDDLSAFQVEHVRASSPSPPYSPSPPSTDSPSLPRLSTVISPFQDISRPSSAPNILRSPTVAAWNYQENPAQYHIADHADHAAPLSDNQSTPSTRSGSCGDHQWIENDTGPGITTVTSSASAHFFSFFFESCMVTVQYIDCLDIMTSGANSGSGPPSIFIYHRNWVNLDRDGL